MYCVHTPRVFLSRTHHRLQDIAWAKTADVAVLHDNRAGEDMEESPNPGVFTDGFGFYNRLGLYSCNQNKICPGGVQSS